MSKESDKALFQIGNVVVLKSGGPDMTVSQEIQRGNAGITRNTSYTAATDSMKNATRSQMNPWTGAQEITRTKSTGF